MNVEIDFTPDDGPMQTLYAVMSREEFDAVRRIVADPDEQGGVVVIPARVTPEGPLHKRVFRVGRIVLREV